MAIHGQAFRSAQAAIAAIDEVSNAVVQQARQVGMGAVEDAGRGAAYTRWHAPPEPW
jgi:hypothetical protein